MRQIATSILKRWKSFAKALALLQAKLILTLAYIIFFPLGVLFRLGVVRQQTTRNRWIHTIAEKKTRDDLHQQY